MFRTPLLRLVALAVIGGLGIMTVPASVGAAHQATHEVTLQAPHEVTLQAQAMTDPAGATAPLLDGGCGAWLDNPHYSSGSRGVIVKTRYNCELGFSMTVNSALTYLYFCPNGRPSGSQESEWTDSTGCRPVRSSNYGRFTVGSNQTVTRYTPPEGQQGSTYKGWYIACTRYNRSDIGTVRVWSAPVNVTW